MQILYIRICASIIFYWIHFDGNRKISERRIRDVLGLNPTTAKENTSSAIIPKMLSLFDVFVLLVFGLFFYSDLILHGKRKTLSTCVRVRVRTGFGLTAEYPAWLQLYST